MRNPYITMLQWLCRSFGCSKQKVEESELTDEEMSAIREVWEKAKLKDVGQHILRSLIQLKPQFKDYFGIQCSEDNLSTLFECKAFMLQAHRIQNFLDTAVSTLGFCPIAHVYAMARRIGQIHFYRGVNFGAENWLAFKKVTVDQVTLDVHRTSLTSDLPIVRKESQLEIHLMSGSNSPPCLALVAWEKFMSAIIREMKRGFLDEARRNCTDESNYS